MLSITNRAMLSVFESEQIKANLGGCHAMSKPSVNLGRIIGLEDDC